MQAQSRGRRFAANPVDRTVMIEGDSQIFAAAVANLLQNAFKFTPVNVDAAVRMWGGLVSLTLLTLLVIPAV